jgi:hypothetical protein
MRRPGRGGYSARCLSALQGERRGVVRRDIGGGRFDDLRRPRGEPVAPRCRSRATASLGDVEFSRRCCPDAAPRPWRRLRRPPCQWTPDEGHYRAAVDGRTRVIAASQVASSPASAQPEGRGTRTAAARGSTSTPPTRPAPRPVLHASATSSSARTSGCWAAGRGSAVSEQRAQPRTGADRWLAQRVEDVAPTATQTRSPGPAPSGWKGSPADRDRLPGRRPSVSGSLGIERVCARPRAERADARRPAERDCHWRRRRTRTNGPETTASGRRIQRRSATSCWRATCSVSGGTGLHPDRHTSGTMRRTFLLEALVAGAPSRPGASAPGFCGAGGNATRPALLPGARFVRVGRGLRWRKWGGTFRRPTCP